MHFFLYMLAGEIGIIVKLEFRVHTVSTTDLFIAIAPFHAVLDEMLAGLTGLTHSITSIQLLFC